MREPNSEMLSEVAREISNRRAEILDDFAKAYLASISPKFPDTPIEQLIGKVELVEQMSLEEVSWYFQLKEGE